MIPTGVSMVVSGGAVSPENHSNEAREIAEQYLYDGDRDRPLNLGYYALLDVADSVAALESAHAAALARIEADNESLRRINDASDWRPRLVELRDELDAMTRYAAALARGLSDYEARAEGWPDAALAASPTPTTEEQA